MEIKAISTRLYVEREKLTSFVFEHLSDIREGDVLVITSKIVALFQGRTAEISQKDLAMRQGARDVVETPWASLVLGDDGWVVNAGVDESNADKKIILLPENPQSMAWLVRNEIIQMLGIKNFGIIITDTRSVPLRAGTIGRAIGYAGFEPFKSYKGKKDLFGRESRYTESNVADSLAAAAVLEMGEGDERMPLALVRGARIVFTDKKTDLKLSFPAENDIFSFIYKKAGQ